MHAVDQRLLPESRWDFSDLNAVFINPTLKRSPAPSNPQALAHRSIAIMRRAQRRQRGRQGRRSRHRG
jgi:hypothetical protein